MRRAALYPTLLLVLLAGVDAGAQGLDLRIGGFYPRLRDCGIPSNVPAEYTMFQDVCELYAVDKGAFDGVYGGIEYNHVVMKNVELAVSIDGSSETVDTFYRDYERPGGGNIFQTLRLQTLPIGLSVRFVPNEGLVVTADLPDDVSAEALAALAATLGRELEGGADHLARGQFHAAFFSAPDGTVFVGGSPIGYVILIGDATVDTTMVAAALRGALARLDGAWRV